MKGLKIVVLFVAVVINYNISAQTVYTTTTGKKYHKPSCHYLKHSKKAIKLDDVKALGYKACKVCKPTASTTKEASNSLILKKEAQPKTTATKKLTATQCTGKTKSGKRCKRNTKNANGRCYQH